MTPSPSMDRGPRRRIAVLAVLVLLISGLLVAWYGGGVAWAIIHVVAPAYLPVRIGDNVTVSGVGMATLPASPGPGIELRVDPRRAEQILREVSPWVRLVPPGLIGDGLSVRGVLMLDKQEGTTNYPVPIVVFIDKSAAPVPRLTGRYMAEDLNRYIRTELGDSLRKRKKWALGHYDIVYRPSIQDLAIYSSTEPPAPGAAVEARTFYFRAKGRIGVALDDNLLRASGTVQVEELSGVIELKLVRDERGLGAEPTFEIRELKAMGDDLPASLRDVVGSELSDLLEKSLNKPKARARLAAKRLPSWFPADFGLDLQITERPEPPIRSAPAP